MDIVSNPSFAIFREMSIVLFGSHMGVDDGLAKGL